MKRLTCKTLTLGLLLCLLAWPAAAQSRIATVDLQRVFDGYYKTRAADITLKDRAAELEKEGKTLMDQYQKMREDYQQSIDDANNQAISAEEREKRKKAAETRLLEIKEMEQQLMQFDRQSRASLDEQKRRMKDNILGEIRTVVNSIARKQNFSMVLDTAAESFNQTPVVFYNSGENDITDVVLAQMNASAPPGSLPATEPKIPRPGSGKP